MNAKARIQDALFHLGHYELETVAWFCDRVLTGQRVYGKYSPETETRDFTKERAEEACDMAVYTAFEEILRRVRAETVAPTSTEEPLTPTRERDGEYEDFHVIKATK